LTSDAEADPGFDVRGAWTLTLKIIETDSNISKSGTVTTKLRALSSSSAFKCIKRTNNTKVSFIHKKEVHTTPILNLHVFAISASAEL